MKRRWDRPLPEVRRRLRTYEDLQDDNGEEMAWEEALEEEE